MCGTARKMGHPDARFRAPGDDDGEEMWRRFARSVAKCLQPAAAAPRTECLASHSHHDTVHTELATPVICTRSSRHRPCPRPCGDPGDPISVSPAISSMCGTAEKWVTRT